MEKGNRSGREQKRSSWTILALALIIGLLAGVLGAVLGAQVLVKQGPSGLQGEKGDTGDVGPQGFAGANGTNSILQVIQSRNETELATVNFTLMEWVNTSDVDASMAVTITVQQNSKILIQFITSQRLEPPASIWIRIVVDGIQNSSKYVCATGPPASGTYVIPGYIDFLTDSLAAGQHTVNVQALREAGSLVLLDRTFTVTEIAA